MIDSTHLENQSWVAGRLTRVAWILVLALVVGTGISTVAKSQGKASKTSQLVQRIEQLEEQIVDMQVVIGTMQSLPRGNGAVAAPVGGGLVAGGGASSAARLDGMETQIRALTAQMAQLSAQMRAANGGGRRGQIDRGYQGQQPPQIRTGNAPAGVAPGTTSPPTTGAISGFDTTTTAVAPGRGGTDPIGGYLAPPNNTGGNGQAVAKLQNLPPAGRSDPKGAYETAYGYLLQQQYGAAETAFREFVKAYPGDTLAGNAQYWLGESFYVRGQYKPAANAFLKGYETYGKGSKAPDSLLKLAMSLERLGHKDAACSSLSELVSRFPGAAAHVQKRAKSERARVGC